MKNPARYRDKMVGPNLPCLASCQDESYRVTLSSAGYPNQGTILRRQEICPILVKIMNICNNKTITGTDGVEDNSLMLKKEELEHKYPNLCEQLMAKADVGKKCSEK